MCSLCINIHMCVGTCVMWTCVGIYAYLYVEAWGCCQESSTVALPPYALKQSLSIKPRALSSKASLTSQLALGISCLSAFWGWNCRWATLPSLAFSEFLGSQLQPWCLQGTCSNCWTKLLKSHLYVSFASFAKYPFTFIDHSLVVFGSLSFGFEKYLCVAFIKLGSVFVCLFKPEVFLISFSCAFLYSSLLKSWGVAWLSRKSCRVPASATFSSPKYDLVKKMSHMQMTI